MITEKSNVKKITYKIEEFLKLIKEEGKILYIDNDNYFNEVTIKIETKK